MKNDFDPKRLKDLRNSYGYTQELVASHLSVCRQAYSHYETGRNKPPMDAIRNLATLYSVSVDELLNLLSPIQTYSITPSEEPIEERGLVDFINNPANKMKLDSLTRKQKELIYYFELISMDDQDEVLNITKMKAQKSKKIRH